jgi:hypothetical protein
MQIIPLYFIPARENLSACSRIAARQKRRGRFYGSTSAANKIEFAHTLSQVENCNNFMYIRDQRVLMGRWPRCVSHKHSEVLKGGMSLRASERESERTF